MPPFADTIMCIFDIILKALWNSRKVLIAPNPNASIRSLPTDAFMLILSLLVSVAFSFSAHADWNPSYLKALNTKHEVLIKAVRAGILPAERGEEADKVWLSVRKNLKIINAKIETLKQNVMENDWKRQEQVLDRLVTTGAERVETVCRAIREMDALLLEQQHEDQGAYLLPGNSMKKTESTTERRFDIDIELAPEDMFRGDLE